MLRRNPTSLLTVLFHLLPVKGDRQDCHTVKWINTYFIKYFILRGVEDILLLGDFNADCGYVSQIEMSSLALTSYLYHWWVPDEADTTVSGTHCAYDR